MVEYELAILYCLCNLGFQENYCYNYLCGFGTFLLFERNLLYFIYVIIYVKSIGDLFDGSKEVFLKVKKEQEYDNNPVREKIYYDC